MKNQIFILLTFLCFSSLLSAQDCPTGLVILNTQNKVDSFIINYPNCTQLDELIIYEDNPSINSITNLNGLSQIVSLNFLRISNCSTLFNVDGLSQLVAVNTNLEISSTAISNLEGFNNLNYVGGTLKIWFGNVNLLSISGFVSLTTIAENLQLDGGPSGAYTSYIESITGFNNLTTIGGDLILRKQPNLTEISGFQMLTEIGNELKIQDLDQMENLNFINTINPLIVGNKISIFYNDRLESLTGLENVMIQEGGDDFITIFENPQLSMCSYEYMCNLLTNSNIQTNIYANLFPCNSVQQIINDCPSTYSSCDGVDLNIPDYFFQNIYRASNSITTSASLNFYGKITAGTEITLEPGFEFNSNTTFEAKIESCILD